MFTGLLNIFLLNCLFKPFVHFSIVLLFFLLICRSSLYILDAYSLRVLCILSIFFHSKTSLYFSRFFCFNEVKGSSIFHRAFCLVLKILLLLGLKFYFHIYSSKYHEVLLITFRTLIHLDYYGMG